MKTKTGRMLALTMVYIVCAPFLAVWFIGYGIYASVQNKRMFGEFDLLHTYKCVAMGMHWGHKTNMVWVKTGVTHGEMAELMLKELE